MRFLLWVQAKKEEGWRDRLRNRERERERERERYWHKGREREIKRERELYRESEKEMGEGGRESNRQSEAGTDREKGIERDWDRDR